MEAPRGWSLVTCHRTEGRTGIHSQVCEHAQLTFFPLSPRSLLPVWCGGKGKGAQLWSMHRAPIPFTAQGAFLGRRTQGNSRHEKVRPRESPDSEGWALAPGALGGRPPLGGRGTGPFSVTSGDSLGLHSLPARWASEAIPALLRARGEEQRRWCGGRGPFSSPERSQEVSPHLTSQPSIPRGFLSFLPLWLLLAAQQLCVSPSGHAPSDRRPRLSSWQTFFS